MTLLRVRMNGNRVDRIKNRRVVVIVLIAVAVFYFVFDPLEWSFMPQCVFHRLTGLQCAGCGSQRMLHALLHGDIAGAFHANALVLVSLPGIAFLAWVESQRTRIPGLYRKVYSAPLVITVGILLVFWMVFRNVLGI